MTLVTLKNWLTGKNSSGERRSLLPGGAERLEEALDGNANPRVISDIVIGMSDGLTVPFALTAGLSSLGSSSLVITGGMTELVSGAISMGLGGFLAAKSEQEHYESLFARSKEAFRLDPGEVSRNVTKALGEYKLSSDTIEQVVNDLKRDDDTVAEFTVKMVHGLEAPSPSRELTSALTIGGAYFVGGFVPLVPYFFAETVITGLYISIGVMVVTLFLFGYVKATASLGSQAPQSSRIRDGFNMLLTGGIAATAAWGVVRALGD